MKSVEHYQYKFPPNFVAFLRMREIRKSFDKTDTGYLKKLADQATIRVSNVGPVDQVTPDSRFNSINQPITIVQISNCDQWITELQLGTLGLVQVQFYDASLIPAEQLPYIPELSDGKKLLSFSFHKSSVKNLISEDSFRGAARTYVLWVDTLVKGNQLALPVPFPFDFSKPNMTDTLQFPEV